MKSYYNNKPRELHDLLKCILTQGQVALKSGFYYYQNKAV